MTDVDIGGFSTAKLDWIPGDGVSSPETTDSLRANGYARFHGAISTQLPHGRTDIKRSGYAAWRTQDRGPTVFGRSLWNIDPYAYLGLRFKSDGRSYLVNLQTESVVPTDLHQHRLFSKRPGEWETVLIKWNDFVRTNYGFVVEPQTELLRQKLRSIGIGLTDRVEGPFELCIERIWATNNTSGTEDVEAETVSKSGLKDKHGKSILWENAKA
jgi:NADH dehydrogenase [ubiquinone] 1 alpha subcomplex assembly factor 1